jgi:hypothetical protein
LIVWWSEETVLWPEHLKTVVPFPRQKDSRTQSKPRLLHRLLCSFWNRRKKWTVSFKCLRFIWSYFRMTIVTIWPQKLKSSFRDCSLASFERFVI